MRNGNLQKYRKKYLRPKKNINKRCVKYIAPLIRNAYQTYVSANASAKYLVYPFVYKIKIAQLPIKTKNRFLLWKPALEYCQCILITISTV
ncbi:hypothetical protein CJD36_018235 [Flavipsychrobacter stenotrophus]|uniref:Uncharacterized protein n=1 Tax=Flavipsychrobacter stenotrophus TaxID=2077091 RepID=A0A2S7SSZ9_9BACT|nr:hypothetical protein CJD36_018235 [Flavipsychrobacter stenotrophus]